MKAGLLVAGLAIASVAIGAPVIQAQSSDPSIIGIVVNRDTNYPVTGVVVEVDGTPLTGATKSDGRYATGTLKPGSYTLRFARPGFDSATVAVLVGDRGGTQVDIVLAPKPQALTDIRVVARRAGKEVFDSVGTANGAPRSIGGGLTWSGAALHSNPHLGQADLLRLVATAPDVAGRSEGYSSVHVRGGSADHTLILLDGIPIENAVHSGELASAVDPAGVEDVTLYSDHVPARFGGRLGGVVEIRTRDAVGPGSRAGVSAGPSLSGRAGPDGIGVTAAKTFRSSRSFGMVSVRQSSEGLGESLLGYGPGEFSPRQWSDALARASFDVGGGRLSAIAFGSHDVMRFNTHLASPGAPASSIDSAASGFSWTSSAIGARWERPDSSVPSGLFVARVWRSNAMTSGSWGPNIDRAGVTNRIMQLGGSVEFSASGKSAAGTGGISVDEVTTSYVTTRGNAGNRLPGWLALGASSRHASAYVDSRFVLGHGVSLLSGLRTTVDASRSGTVNFEPRASLVFAPGKRLSLSASYDRTNQFLQSLRNEESLFDGVIGLNLLNAADASIPVAQSSMSGVLAKFSVTRRTGITFGAYSRHMTGILLPTQSSLAPFATDSFSVGSGDARGWYAAMEHATDHLTLQGVAGETETSRTSGQLTYRPGFASARFGSLALGYRPAKRTMLRAAISGATGRSAAVSVGDFSWDWQESAGHGRSLQGSSGTGQPGGIQLPSYLRLDLGVRHEINVRRPGKCASDENSSATASGSYPTCHRTAITIFGSLLNALNRTNTAGVVQPGATTLSTATSLVLTPRSIEFGLEWKW